MSKAELVARTWFKSQASQAAERIGLDEPVKWDNLDDIDRGTMLKSAKAVIEVLEQNFVTQYGVGFRMDSEVMFAYEASSKEQAYDRCKSLVYVLPVVRSVTPWTLIEEDKT